MTNRKVQAIPLVEKKWFCRYPRPDIITYDRRKQFLGHAFNNNIIENKYGIKAKCAATANTQANLIIGKIHQLIENLVHMFELKNNYLDKDDPW